MPFCTYFIGKNQGIWLSVDEYVESTRFSIPAGESENYPTTLEHVLVVYHSIAQYITVYCNIPWHNMVYQNISVSVQISRLHRVETHSCCLMEIYFRCTDNIKGDGMSGEEEEMYLSQELLSWDLEGPCSNQVAWGTRLPSHLLLLSMIVTTWHHKSPISLLRMMGLLLN